MNAWDIAAITYGAVAILTLLPALVPMLHAVKLHPGGASFDQVSHFSEPEKKRLSDHYSRLLGTLGFWKKNATIYKRFHYYCVCWTLIFIMACSFTRDSWSAGSTTVAHRHRVQPRCVSLELPPRP